MRARFSGTACSRSRAGRPAGTETDDCVCCARWQPCGSKDQGLHWKPKGFAKGFQPDPMGYRPIFFRFTRVKFRWRAAPRGEICTFYHKNVGARDTASRVARAVLNSGTSWAPGPAPGGRPGVRGCLLFAQASGALVGPPFSCGPDRVPGGAGRGRLRRRPGGARRRTRRRDG